MDMGNPEPVGIELVLMVGVEEECGVHVGLLWTSDEPEGVEVFGGQWGP